MIEPGEVILAIAGSQLMLTCHPKRSETSVTFMSTAKLLPACRESSRISGGSTRSTVDDADITFIRVKLKIKRRLNSTRFRILPLTLFTTPFSYDYNIGSLLYFFPLPEDLVTLSKACLNSSLSPFSMNLIEMKEVLIWLRRSSVFSGYRV